MPKALERRGSGTTVEGARSSVRPKAMLLRLLAAPSLAERLVRPPPEVDLLRREGLSAASVCRLLMAPSAIYKT